MLLISRYFIISDNKSVNLLHILTFIDIINKFRKINYRGLVHDKESFRMAKAIISYKVKPIYKVKRLIYFTLGLNRIFIVQILPDLEMILIS